MMANWFWQLLLVYALLAAGLVVCLYLFYTVKVEVWAARKRVHARLDAIEASLAGLGARLEELQEGLENLRADPGAARTAAPSSGINLTRRAQVLRLRRRGESVPTIAGALSLPQNEVELLLKVQRLLVEQS
jgi:hypothetical protein